MFEYLIELKPEEAMLIDWVLTMHHYDDSLLGFLMKPDIQNWREQAGSIISNGKGSIRLVADDIKLLLTLIPVTFRFGQDDVGYSLKVKLYRNYLGLMEVPSASQDEASDKAGNSPETQRESIQPE